jgi:hypothetical protein
MAEERKLGPAFEMFAWLGWQVDEFIGFVGARLSGADQRHLVLPALSDLLGDRLKYDFRATPNAVKTGESE